MAEMSREQVLKIANDAKLALTDEETDKFKDELSSVIHFTDKLQELDTDGVEPTIHMQNLQNVMRDDRPTDWVSKDDVLKNAPDEQDGYFRVPSILD